MSNKEGCIVFEAVPESLASYKERTSRNWIAWISEDEQLRIHQWKTGTAGAGGMGGWIDDCWIRVGVGSIVIADNGLFDRSNINRQLAAREDTIGSSKALMTARELRRITSAVEITVYPAGITTATAADFVEGCTVIFDEIEFFCPSGRIALHQAARVAGIPVFNGNVVGGGTRLFLFTPESDTMEDCLGLSYEEALDLEMQMADGSEVAKERIIQSVLRGLVPEIPSYRSGDRERLIEGLRQGQAGILAPHPMMAAGHTASLALWWLLQREGLEERPGVQLPKPMPSCIYYDLLREDRHTIKERWY